MDTGRRATQKHVQISWLPIDSRLVPSIFSFGRVRGIARIFLLVEMLLAVLVVVGTCMQVILLVFFR